MMSLGEVAGMGSLAQEMGELMSTKEGQPSELPLRAYPIISIFWNIHMG